MLQTSPSTSQSLVRSSEQVTKLLSATLTNDTTEAILTRTNIGNQTNIRYTRTVYCHTIS